MGFGLTGFEAFLIGSSLFSSVMGTFLYIFLNIFFNNERSKSLLFTILLLIPINNGEFDYFLGQQSHLFNVIMCFGITIMMSKILIYTVKNNFYFAIVCIILFFITVESPVRGLFIIIPLSISVFLLFRKTFNLYVVFFVISFITAYVLNKYLMTLYPISIDYLHTSTVAPLDVILNNVVTLVKSTIYSYTSNIGNYFGNSSSYKKVFLIINLLWSILFSVIIIFYSTKIAIFTKQRILMLFNDNNVCVNMDNNKILVYFICFVAIFGIIVGVISTSIFNPINSVDPRHYLWAIFIIKFLIIYFIYHFMSHKNINLIKMNCFLLIIIICISSWSLVISNLKKRF